ncbi:uncharacterized protein TNCV_120621 [Trichonephila clavipes]|nr:uncharacterized protein TNCV_120621 [Trichonephila clavipes]
MAHIDPLRCATPDLGRTCSLNPLTLRRAKRIMSIYIDSYTAMTQNTNSFGKPWETLDTVGPIPRHMERAEAVALFRLTTGHDSLGVYLYWFSVDANEACPICGHARMDSDYLLQCTRLDEGGSASNGQEAKQRVE